jgi:hypothetical protein
VRPPRAAFVDYPLGHTAGKPGDPADQLALVRGALDLLRAATEPSAIVDLRRVWSDDRSWKEHPLSSGAAKGDGRAARSPLPAYQTEEDRVQAEARHAPGARCGACVGADP